MCGLLFVKSDRAIAAEQFRLALSQQRWRGPDATGVATVSPNVHMGHVRLSIIDLSNAADQPMNSRCGRYTLIYNGEIYNHSDLRKRHSLHCTTSSDTETILEGFAARGVAIFSELEGMFALVIFDNYSGDWWATRDRFGIKPLFRYSRNGTEILASETITIRSLVPCTFSEVSVEEWKVIRRPVPGYSYFNEIEEVLPGSILANGRVVLRMAIDNRMPQADEFDQTKVEDLIRESVRAHELCDTEKVCLLSGGIDSSLITALSTANRAYTVGLPENNEFAEAAQTANQLGKELIRVEVTPEALIESWKTLITLRGEPLSVPNEGLIFHVCQAMRQSEKVVLTGEGADEVFFGYDRIFRAAGYAASFTREDFYSLYGYTAGTTPSGRLVELVEELWQGKSAIEFVEDFFLTVHLPGLLRRMDSASMAASKETRVPFVSNRLTQYMYRRPAAAKISSTHAKIPLRSYAACLRLDGPLNRPKIGFSSSINKNFSRAEEYEFFRNINLETLQWS
jgi:asparagine synthase (glutamine-hydrolysing)